MAEEKFFVTRDSQELNDTLSSREYAGMRDLSDPERLGEESITAEDGAVVGVKNRVRAGLATFENPNMLKRKHQEEHRIIVYTTSVGTVRGALNDCKYVTNVFYNLRVKAEERDVYMEQRYLHELEERLGGRPSVPQVFISGQHIGGREEIEELNEIGALRKMVADIPKVEASGACPTCGGYHFVPCIKCGGSKNSVSNPFTSEFRALKCTACNENGMQKCPQCNT